MTTPHNVTFLPLPNHHISLFLNAQLDVIGNKRKTSLYCPRSIDLFLSERPFGSFSISPNFIPHYIDHRFLQYANAPISRLSSNFHAPFLKFQRILAIPSPMSCAAAITVKGTASDEYFIIINEDIYEFSFFLARLTCFFREYFFTPFRDRTLSHFQVIFPELCSCHTVEELRANIFATSYDTCRPRHVACFQDNLHHDLLKADIIFQLLVEISKLTFSYCVGSASFSDAVSDVMPTYRNLHYVINNFEHDVRLLKAFCSGFEDFLIAHELAHISLDHFNNPSIFPDAIYKDLTLKNIKTFGHKCKEAEADILAYFALEPRQLFSSNDEIVYYYLGVAAHRLWNIVIEYVLYASQHGVLPSQKLAEIGGCLYYTQHLGELLPTYRPSEIERMYIMSFCFRKIILSTFDVAHICESMLMENVLGHTLCYIMPQIITEIVHKYVNLSGLTLPLTSNPRIHGASLLCDIKKYLSQVGGDENATIDMLYSKKGSQPT